MNSKSSIPYNPKTPFTVDLLHPKYLFTWIGLCLLYPITKIPLAIQHSLGRMLGVLFLAFNKERKNIAKINLSLCYPQLTNIQIEKLVIENFKNLGIGIFEMGISWWSSEKGIKKLTKKYSNRKLLKDSVKDDQGMLVLIKHSTHLELDIRLISRNINMGGMYRTQKNLVINHFMTKSRNSYLKGVVSNLEAKKGIVWIKKGLKFFYAADQDYGRKVSKFVPFFDNLAATVTLPGDLAIKGITVIFADVKRDGLAYEVNLHKFENLTSRNEFLLAMNKYYEKVISKAPAEYLWMHRRFKNTFEESKNIYPIMKSREKRRKKDRMKKGEN